MRGHGIQVQPSTTPSSSLLVFVIIISTLAAAGLGNAFSDLAGVFAGSHIEHQAEL